MSAGCVPSDFVDSNERRGLLKILKIDVVLFNVLHTILDHDAVAIPLVRNDWKRHARNGTIGWTYQNSLFRVFVWDSTDVSVQLNVPIETNSRKYEIVEQLLRILSTT